MQLSIWQNSIVQIIFDLKIALFKIRVKRWLHIMVFSSFVRESLIRLFLIPGIVIEEEHLDTTDCTASRRKTTSITLTTADNAANRINQHNNQGTIYWLDGILRIRTLEFYIMKKIILIQILIDFKWLFLFFIKNFH